MNQMVDCVEAEEKRININSSKSINKVLRAKGISDPEMITLVTTEYVDSGKKRVMFYYVPLAKPSLGTPLFPRLSSSQASFEMSKQEIIQEVFAVLGLATSHDIFSGTYIYSIQVIEPRNFGQLLDLDTLEVEIPASLLVGLKSGYLYHSLLYSYLSDQTRQKLLEKFFENANEVEITLRLHGQNIRRTRVAFS